MVYYNNESRITYSKNKKEELNMFDWLREIRDNIKAEWDLATANPSPELCASVRRAIESEDGDLCAKFEDSTTWLGHGRILGDMEEKNLTIDDPVEVIAKTTGWSDDQVRATVEAQKIVRFLRAKLYENEQIKRIGSIAMSLQNNNGDISRVTAETGADVESVNAVIQLMNEYAASIGGQIVWSVPVATSEPEKETEQQTKTPKKTSSKATAKKEMVKPISVPAGAN